MPQENFYEELVIAGYGGQGIIILGKLLAQAAMKNAVEVTYMPAYGAEVRGGAASCMIVLSDEPVASPVITHADSLITMNKASFDRYVPSIKSGGLVVMNSSLIDHHPDRDDVEVLAVPADEIAIELGSPRSANMVALGAYLQHKELLGVAAVAACLPDILAPRHHDTLPANRKALYQGMTFAGGASVH